MRRTPDQQAPGRKPRAGDVKEAKEHCRHVWRVMGAHRLWHLRQAAGWTVQGAHPQRHGLIVACRICLTSLDPSARP